MQYNVWITTWLQQPTLSCLCTVLWPLTYPQTTSENSELQREIPRLHAVLASKSRRIGELESLLQETKQAANQEYERLHSENERVKQNFMTKLKDKEKEGKVLLGCCIRMGKDPNFQFPYFNILEQLLLSLTPWPVHDMLLHGSAIDY